ncbi:hypothetical protein AB0H28_30035 [Micromonospora sp. NPDC050980]|uniref:hypothetical protein n=1 Tax=Micromonospora sp. NPDC050980 TaxID=3155161 RepID=UPI0033D2D127
MPAQTPHRKPGTKPATSEILPAMPPINAAVEGFFDSNFVGFGVGVGVGFGFLPPLLGFDGFRAFAQSSSPQEP